LANKSAEIGKVYSLGIYLYRTTLRRGHLLLGRPHVSLIIITVLIMMASAA